MQTVAHSEFQSVRRALLQRGLGVMVTGAGALGGCSLGRPAAPFDPGQAHALPGYQAHGVQFSQVPFKGRDAIRVELTQEAQAALLSGAPLGNGPTFAIPADVFANGVLEVDVAAQINGRGARDSRGFVGLAFHIDDRNETFEAVYLRMTNGTLNTPPPPAPRDSYAAQYISFPDRYWRKLRQEHPNRYEKAAPVAIESWHRLRLKIQGSALDAFVDGQKVLTVSDLRFPNRPGRVGLWVDDGTTGYFSDLRVRSRS